MFGEERGCKETAARMHVTWVRDTGEGELEMCCVLMLVQEIAICSEKAIED